MSDTCHTILPKGAGYLVEAKPSPDCRPRWATARRGPIGGQPVPAEKITTRFWLCNSFEQDILPNEDRSSSLGPVEGVAYLAALNFTRDVYTPSRARLEHNVQSRLVF
jgi:hypothetical protein